MNEKEKLEMIEMLESSKRLAQEIIEVCKESGNSEYVSATALAIAYGSICVLADISIHKSMSMLMTIYKQTVVLAEDNDGKLS